MSRSYKKTPINKDKSKADHKASNRRVRRLNNESARKQKDVYMTNGNAYRREYSQYDISDYSFYYPDSQRKRDNESGRRNYYYDKNTWEKLYRRK